MARGARMPPAAAPPPPPRQSHVARRRVARPCAGRRHPRPERHDACERHANPYRPYRACGPRQVPPAQRSRQGAAAVCTLGATSPPPPTPPAPAGRLHPCARCRQPWHGQAGFRPTSLGGTVLFALPVRPPAARARPLLRPACRRYSGAQYKACGCHPRNRGAHSGLRRHRRVLCRQGAGRAQALPGVNAHEIHGRLRPRCMRRAPDRGQRGGAQGRRQVGRGHGRAASIPRARPECGVRRAFQSAATAERMAEMRGMPAPARFAKATGSASSSSSAPGASLCTPQAAWISAGPKSAAPSIA